MAFYSKAHYRRVSPPSDTPETIAARMRHLHALELAREDVAARYPNGITVENAVEILAYQQARIQFRCEEAR